MFDVVQLDLTNIYSTWTYVPKNFLPIRRYPHLNMFMVSLYCTDVIYVHGKFFQLVKVFWQIYVQLDVWCCCVQLDLLNFFWQIYVQLDVWCCCVQLEDEDVLVNVHIVEKQLVLKFHDNMNDGVEPCNVGHQARIVHTLTQRRPDPVNLRLLQITQLVTSQHVFVLSPCVWRTARSRQHLLSSRDTIHIVPLLVRVHVDQTTVADHVTDQVHPRVFTGRRIVVLDARVAHALLLHCLMSLHCPFGWRSWHFADFQ